MPRLPLVIIALATVTAGLCVHRFAPESFAADAAGDVLYALLIAVLLAIVAPRAPWSILCGVAFIWCIGVELLQITSLPGRLGEAFPPFRVVLGTTFSAWDLLWYAVGVAIAAGTLRWLRR